MAQVLDTPGLAGEATLPCGCEGFGVKRCPEFVALWDRHARAWNETQALYRAYAATRHRDDVAYQRWQRASKAEVVAWAALCAHVGEAV